MGFYNSSCLTQWKLLPKKKIYKNTTSNWKNAQHPATINIKQITTFIRRSFSRSTIITIALIVKWMLFLLLNLNNWRHSRSASTKLKKCESDLLQVALLFLGMGRESTSRCECHNRESLKYQSVMVTVSFIHSYTGGSRFSLCSPAWASTWYPVSDDDRTLGKRWPFEFHH